MKNPPTSRSHAFPDTRRGVAQLEMILILPTVAFLFVMIFYVASASVRKSEMVSSCRNQTWDERYKGNNVTGLRPFQVSNMENGVVYNSREETIQTGLFFDRWKQEATTQHLVLARTWDHQSVELDESHPIYMKSDIIAALGINFAPGALQNALWDTLEDHLWQDILPDEVPEFVFDANSLDEIKETFGEIIDGYCDEVEELTREALEFISFDTSGLNDADDLLEDIGTTQKSVEDRIKETEDTLSAITMRDGFRNRGFGSSTDGTFRPVSAAIDKDDIDKLKAELQKLKVIYDDLKQMYNTAKSLKNEVVKLYQKIVEKKLDNLEDRIKALRNETISKLESLRQQFESFINGIRNKPYDLIKHGKAAEKFVKDAADAVKNFQEQLTKIISEVKTLRDEILALVEKIKSLRDQFNKLKADLAEL